MGTKRGAVKKRITKETQIEVRLVLTARSTLTGIGFFDHAPFFAFHAGFGLDLIAKRRFGGRLSSHS